MKEEEHRRKMKERYSGNRIGSVLGYIGLRKRELRFPVWVIKGEMTP